MDVRKMAIIFKKSVIIDNPGFQKLQKSNTVRLYACSCSNEKLALCSPWFIDLIPHYVVLSQVHILFLGVVHVLSLLSFIHPFLLLASIYIHIPLRTSLCGTEVHAIRVIASHRIATYPRRIVYALHPHTSSRTSRLLRTSRFLHVRISIPTLFQVSFFFHYNLRKYLGIASFNCTAFT